MSERNPRNLRYLRQQSLEHERKLYENYFYDLIQNYGIDVTYYRQDVQFPNKLDLTPTLSGLENLIYGERSNTSYYLSGDMVLYMEVDNDLFELNKFGLLPNENITLYFTINDFNSKFASQLGNKKDFTDTITFTGYHWDSGSFDGISTYAVVSGINNTSVLEPSETKTMMGWFRFNDLSDSSEIGWLTVGKSQAMITNSTLSFGCELIYHVNRIRFYVMDKNIEDGKKLQAISYNQDEFEPLLENVWYHIAATHNGPNSRMKLYVNGILVDEATTPSSIERDPIKPQKNIVIGNWDEYVYQQSISRTAWNRSFNGHMDDIRIFDEQLTTSEIISSMNGDMVSSDNLMMWYKIEKDVDPFNLTDSSGNGHDALIYGSTYNFWSLAPTIYESFVGNDVLSGMISTIVNGVPGTTSVSSFDIHFDTEVGYAIPINPYISESVDYVVSGGNYLGAGYGTITLTSSSYTGSATVGVLYYEPTPENVYSLNIMPQVGDFFRMPFFDGNHEEFEITNISDRMMTGDGINPLLGKYVWKCAAVRRNPSHEDVIGGMDTEEMNNAELHNIQSLAVEEISNSIYDYPDDENSVYGGYDDEGPYKVHSESYESVLENINEDDVIQTDGDVNYDYVDSEFNENIFVNGIIFTFDYGPSYLLSDGYNLFFYNENSVSTQLTNDSHSTGIIPDDVVGLKYLRTDGDDLYFVNNDQTSWRLTSNFDSDPYVNSIIDISTILPQTSEYASDGMFVVLSRGFYLFSDGINLFAVNDANDSTQLTSN